MNASCSMRTPSGVGAIAAIDVVGDVDDALASLGIRAVPTGRVALRDLAGVDRGVVARWNERSCTLMPHGGTAVVVALFAALERAGIAVEAPDPMDAFPEAQDRFEALALGAIATTESPRAVELLLDQPRRWRERGDAPIDDALRSRSATLDRLLTPPVVAAVGATNIGKSSLLNALARREVSIVHDAPGVTTDHVGASLVLDGLAVRWLDLPGIEEGRPVGEAAIDEARHADLLVLCADPGSGWVEPAALGIEPGGSAVVRVGLRSDLGPVPGTSVLTSATESRGLDELAAAIRRSLVPDADLDHPGPWLFDRRLGGPGAAIVRP